MITNTFNKISDLIGFNIEKSPDGSFIISIAYVEKNVWKAKTLSGISGDFDNETLIKQVNKKGYLLEKVVASAMFSSASSNFPYFNEQ